MYLNIKTHIEKRRIVIDSLLSNQSKIESVVDKIISCVQSSGTIYTCGNGGSAASALHISTEFVVKYRKIRLPIKSVCLNSNPCHLTAIANDFGLSYLFSRQLTGVITKNDLLLAYTTSGRSENIIEACKVSKSEGSTVIGFTGEYCDKIIETSDIIFGINTLETPIIQECHDAINHIICEILEGIDTDAIKESTKYTDII